MLIVVEILRHCMLQLTDVQIMTLSTYHDCPTVFTVYHGDRQQCTLQVLVVIFKVLLANTEDKNIYFLRSCIPESTEPQTLPIPTVTSDYQGRFSPPHAIVCACIAHWIPSNPRNATTQL